MKTLPFLALLLLLASVISSPAQMQFTNVTAAAGINSTFSYSNVLQQFFTIEDAYSAGGAVAEDFDGDGWMDLYVLGGGDSPNRLYINQHNGTFVDQAAARGLALTGPYKAVSAADFFGRGHLDVFLSSATGTNLLLTNDGTGHFTVAQVIVTAPGPSTPAFGDLESDGLLDLALGEWNSTQAPDLNVYHNTGTNFQLWQTFDTPFVYSPRFADLENNGHPDLLVMADWGYAVWLRNDGTGLLHPGGTFTSQNAMGAAVGDVNNTGNLDVFISGIRDFGTPDGNWGTTGNRLLKNDGSAHFTDITDSAGVRDGFWAWGCEFADFDNDGLLDLFQVNGWPETVLPDEYPKFANQPARLYRNLGNYQFTEIAAASGAASNMSQGRSVVVFDYDNDGQEDLFVVNNSTVVSNADGSFSLLPGTPVLLHNITGNSNAWLNVQLAGAAPPYHTQGVGARVYLTTGGTQQMRELSASGSFGGHGPGRIAHFGLGTNTSAATVRALWPNGDQTQVQNIAANQSLTLNSPVATVSQRSVDPHQAVTAAIASNNLPAGETVSWSVNNVTFPNPATITLSTPGTYQLVATILNSNNQFLRSETLAVTVINTNTAQMSMARVWDEQALSAIRIDNPNPPKHARALFYTSVAMWDCWAAYDTNGIGYLHRETASAANIDTARGEAMSYAAYRVLTKLYATSANALSTQADLNAEMAALGFDPTDTSTTGSTPDAVGNRVAQDILSYASTDGAINTNGYFGTNYTAINPSLAVGGLGTTMYNSNHWQPLLISNAVTQNGLLTSSLQTFVGSNWGGVRPFSLTSLDANNLYIEPVPPPALGGATDQAFKTNVQTVVEHSSQLDSSVGINMDISPASRGNNTLGLNDGTGHLVNPATGQPYTPEIVNSGDYYRVLAEYWADGPNSETPPGHWNVLANQVSDNTNCVFQIGGTGPVVNRLEWDVKLYLTVNAAEHDAAIACWGGKRVYDTIRPISAIRFMGEHGQSSDPNGPSYDTNGLPLVPGLIAVVTASNSAPGQYLQAYSNYIGQVAIDAWSAASPTNAAGVGWVLAANWFPYQKSTFVTPSFPGYISGHSTFSRAGAEVLTEFTGSPFWPGGLGGFLALSNSFLSFSPGPSANVQLEWATYYDAADMCGISRIYGGIHYPADDFPGRIMGSQVGIGVWKIVTNYFNGSILNHSFAARLSPTNGGALNLGWQSTRGLYYMIQQSTNSGSINFTNLGGWTWASNVTQNLQLPPLPNQALQSFFRIIQAPNPQ